MKPRVMLWFWGRRGGGPHYAYEMARALAQRDDLELHLSISRQSDFFNETLDLGLPTQVINTYSDLANAVAALARIPFVRMQFLSYLKKHSIDLVYCPMTHLWNLPILWPFAGNKIKYLLTNHDFVPHPGEIDLVRRTLMLHENKFADGLITLSHCLDSQLQEYGFKKPIWTIPHGPFYYRTHHLRPRQAPIDRPARVLFFGRLLAYKGIPLLLEAVDIIHRRRGNIELKILGKGNCEPFAAQLAASPFATMENRWIDEREIPGAISEADLVVLPYLEASQSGVVAACQGLGVPVVVTPVGALAEQVLKSGMGIVSRDTSAEAVADAIMEMIYNPVTYEACSNRHNEKSCEILWHDAAETVTKCIHSLVDPG